MNKQQQAEDQLQALLDTVEEIRERRYPHLSADMVRDLLRLHADAGTSHGDLARGAEQAVERHLPSEG